MCRAKDRESFNLFPKGKRDLYSPSGGNEMVTLRGTSPGASEEARKKELEAMEASNDVETFSPTPVPQTDSKTLSLSFSNPWLSLCVCGSC